MLKRRIAREFRALVLGKGRFPRFAPMLALMGAVGLGLGLAENAIAGGLQAHAGFAPRQVCNSAPVINPAVFCRTHGGELDSHPDRGPICSGLDINDTFCIIESPKALSCQGLYKHVRCCNENFNRPALDPFHCAGVCSRGYEAKGAKCVLDRAQADEGIVFEPGPIPMVAFHVGEVFRVTATITSGRVTFAWSPPLSAGGDGLVATAYLPRGVDWQGTRRAVSERLVTLRTKFAIRPNASGGGRMRTTMHVFTVTVLAKRKPLVIFMRSGGAQSRLPEYGALNLSYGLTEGNDDFTGLSRGRIGYEGSRRDGALVVTLLARDPAAFLGALRLTATLVFGCAPKSGGVSPASDQNALKRQLADAAASGDYNRFCDRLRQVARPNWLTVYHQALRPRPLPPGAGWIIGRALDYVKNEAGDSLCPPCERPLQILAGQDSMFLPLIRRLVEEHGISMNQRDYKGRTALMLAAGAATADERMFDYVLAETAARNISFPQMAHSILVSLVLSGSALVCPEESDYDDCSGNTALHYAAEAGNAHRVGALLGRKAKVNQANRNGQTPIFPAVKSEDVEAIRALRRAGAELDRKDASGKWPLHYAAETNPQVVCALWNKAPRDEWNRLISLRTLDNDRAIDIAKDKGASGTDVTLIAPWDACDEDD